MGKIKHISKIKELVKEMPVFTSGDIERVVGNKNYAHLLLHNLVKKGEIFRIKKGWYSFREDSFLSVFCFKPSYLGLQSALSFHDLWEQETNPVVITSKNVRKGVRRVFGVNVVVHYLKPEYLFGVTFLEKEDYLIPVSDVEKTLIDLIYFDQNNDKKLIGEIKKRADEKKTESYLKKYPSWFRKKYDKSF